MLAKEIFFLSARELGRRLRQREFTSVELTEGYLERLRRLGPQLNAVVTLTADRALEEARAADGELRRGRARGPLHGVPYGVKDLLATRGIPTTWGAEPYRDQVFDHDATVVTRLRDAGAVLVAKLAMVELAGGLGYDEADASFTGPGLTPWNTDFWSGGSSSGPGSAVAAGLVGFAIGSETSGSILTPSAFSGVCGLRPTYGLVSRHGAMALCWTLDKLGPMCRTADDCGLVLAAIAGADPADPTSVPNGFAWGAAPAGRRKRWRIAVPKGVVEQVQPAVRDAFEASMQVLAASADITRDVEWPDFPWGPSVGIIVNAEGAAAFLPLLESGGAAKLRCPADRVGGYGAMMTFAVDYLQALRVRAPMKRAVNALFEKYDVIAAPTRSTVSYPIGKKFRDAYPDVRSGPALIPAGNLCGLPAVCVPNGFGDHGLPTSLSLMGAAFSERTLLEVAAAYQKETDWHARQPPVS
jgi:aspartyl-tRNA(Asn)/glutamyl-tRNA(Gln) amidotransferase subunit A